MKHFFIETRYKKRIRLPKEVIDRLPSKVGLFTTVQFIDSLDDMKKQIMDSGREVFITESRNYYYRGKSTQGGQLLGCNTEKLDSKAEGFLYVGDGVFHPRILAFNNEGPVHIYDPISAKYTLLDREELKRIQDREKGAYLRFLSSTKVGVVVSTKPGQNLFLRSQKLKEKYPDKRFYYLVFDTVDYQALENFPFIEVFVNTACPRMGLDDSKSFPKPVVNLSKVL